MCLGCEFLKQLPDQMPAGEFGSIISVLCAGMLAQISQEDRAIFYQALINSTEKLIDTLSTLKH